MKKNMFPLVFIGIVAVLIIYAGMPAYKESQRPVNRLIAKGRDAGGGTIIQLVTNPNEMEQTMAISKEIHKMYNGKVVMAGVYVDSDPNFAHDLNLKMPAYVIYDVDGNISTGASGLLTKNSAIMLLQNVHMH